MVTRFGPLCLSIGCLLILFGASTAEAAITWLVDADVEWEPFEPEDGPHSGMLSLEITLISDGERVHGVSGSIVGSNWIGFTNATLSSEVLVQIPTEPGAGWGGLTSRPNGPGIGGVVSAGHGLRFFEGVSVLGTTETGARDISPVTMVAGGPQFRVELEVFFNAILTVGVNPELGDAVVGAGVTPLRSRNSIVSFVGAEPRVVVVPEPATALLLGCGLAGLAWRRDHVAPARRHSSQRKEPQVG